MQIFLAVLLIAAIALELHSLLDGLKHLRFDYRTDKREVEPDEEVAVQAMVVNDSWVPASYVRASIAYPTFAILPDGVHPQKHQFHQSVETVFRLWGRQRVSRTLTVRFQKRGVHYFRGATLYRGDFMGLHENHENYAQQRYVVVYPKPLEDDTLLSAMGSYCGDLIAQRHLLQDPILTMGLREYTGREPMKTISWSQTARRGKLMVREFDYTRDMSCAVLLVADDIDPVEIPLMDTCCSAVRTVCQTLADRNVHVHFRTNARMWGLEQDESGIWSCDAQANQMSNLLNGLALSLTAPVRTSMRRLAVDAIRAEGAGTAFVVVAPRDSAQLREVQRILREESNAQVLTLLGDAFYTPDIERS